MGVIVVMKNDNKNEKVVNFIDVKVKYQILLIKLLKM